jgi:hypothetical protein
MSEAIMLLLSVVLPLVLGAAVYVTLRDAAKEEQQ